MPTERNAVMEFHVSRKARDLYSFDQSLFSLNGNVVLANFLAARTFAQKMNQRRDLVHFPERAVRAGQINAMGLIDEIMHYVSGLYRQQKNPAVMQQALEFLNSRLGQDELQRVLREFAAESPPLAVYQRRIPLDDYLKGQTAGVPNRQLVLEELLMLWLANANPAFSPYAELFDDASLEKETAYRPLIAALGEFFEQQPHFGPNNLSLVDMLREPALAVPHSLTGQLEYIREKWGQLLGGLRFRLLSGLDLVAEEEKMRLWGGGGGAGPGPILTYEFSAQQREEPEQYSLDKEWMPRAVLMAKSTYVWLDQLSKKYQRPVTRLDEIPDEELDSLARYGFTGLWLIGLWERSRASRRIKQLCGKADAVASAYSLLDYRISDDLGGESAFDNLRTRARQRGLRLAGDMVPNHVGIDCPWVVEHPDWFISRDDCPFPSYTFNGEDLSSDGRVGIYLEDHYYDHTDAAVVFKRLDKASGSAKYIYHGNDGTSMPWNDTAQLNYLNPQVRESVIQTILNVTRRFPIIRFDAAMTLSKKHYQRLWFPEPGTGGAIPTRSEYALTRQQFDAAMPVEFWREVVDRVAQEAPDTLLLAEAFWMMEGYFVRTLGMHRVYNSAFMNMLKAEDNANYRTTIKNVLEFDPEILKRFVNFMNNPDEETAVAQFGKDDKYFGVCTMMVTMPGLPMFGHGQVEGFTEKYGMEYRRAYWDEQPDPQLLWRHERELFPLLHRRYLFAEVKEFYLYDFYAPQGHVNEDVFAYSNRAGNERALIVYHNRFANAAGWVGKSVAYLDKATGGKVQKTLGEGLGLQNQDGFFCVFRDQVSGLEYVRSSREMHEKGLYVELGAYKRHVFLDFREVQDNEWHHYAHLAAYLDGRGVPSIDEALKETFLLPIHQAFKELASPDNFRRLGRARLAAKEGQPEETFVADLEAKSRELLQQAARFAGVTRDSSALAAEMYRELQAILHLGIGGKRSGSQSKEQLALARYLLSRLDGEWEWNCLLGWWCVHALGKIVTLEGYEAQSRSWIDEWLLGKVVGGVLLDLGLEEKLAWRGVTVIKLATSHQRLLAAEESDTPAPSARLASDTPPCGASECRGEATRAYRVLNDLLKDDEVQQFLGVNRYRDVLWFNKEAFDDLLWWLMVVTVVDRRSREEDSGDDLILRHAHAAVVRLAAEAEASGYQLEDLLRRLQTGEPEGSRVEKGGAEAASRDRKAASRSAK